MVTTASGKLLPALIWKRLTDGNGVSDVYGVYVRLGPGLNNARVYGDHYAGSLQPARFTRQYLPVLEAQDRIDWLTREARLFPQNEWYKLERHRFCAIQTAAKAEGRMQWGLT